jgi:hypothetical protein
MNNKLIITILTLGSAVGSAQASLHSSTDQAAFLAETGATSVGGYPSGTRVTSFTAGEAHFQSVSPSTFGFGEWTGRLSGTDMGLNDKEQFNVSFANPVHSFGFDLVEPQNDPNVNAPFVDSTFTMEFYSLGLLVGTHTFNAPNDAASFVGVWMNNTFDQVQLRETVGGIENEFFGTFYSGKTLPTGVPDGGSSLAMVGGVCGLLASASSLRRARQTAAGNVLNQ